MDTIHVRPIGPQDHQEVLALAAALPEHFDRDAITRAIPNDIAHQHCLVAKLHGQIAGFITLYVAEGRLHIGWLATRRDLHRRGIGRALILAAERRARDIGISELATYTLSDSVDYAPYVSTREFYRAMGFHIAGRKRTDNPSCPEELHLIKRVSET